MSIKSVVCLICGTDIDMVHTRCFSQHIKNVHNLTSQEYYDSYLTKHTDNCVICGSVTKFIDLNNGYRETCSVECRKSAKYKEILQHKKEKTSIINYGSLDNANIEKNKSRRNTMISNHGVDNPMKSPTIKNKMKKTVITRYGVDNISKLDSVKQSKKISTEKTNMIRYGVGNVFQDKSIQNQISVNKRKNTWDMFVTQLLNKHITPLFSKDDYITNNEKSFIFLCGHCKNEFVSNCYDTQKLAISTINCECQKCPNGTSIKEAKLNTVISEYVNTISNKRFSKNNKTYELDIYLPEHNLGIEFNGLYWHSDTFKDKDYHINKTKWFQDNFGIDVIHIFENEWDNKRDIVMSIIKNRLGLNAHRIYGRKTIKKEITQKEYSAFLVMNHIQGSVISKIRLGLFYEDELVSVVGIGKSRFKKNETELHRFCNKKGYSVLGGFSKLLKGFDNLITYCDIRYFNAEGYKTIGFVEESRTAPNYFYFKKDQILSRYQCQKHKQSKLLPVFSKSETGYENMLNNGYHRVYDCGNIRLTLRKE